MKLNIKAFAITFSLICGLGVFSLTWWIMILNGIAEEKTFLSLIYPGYEISPVGSIIGLLWGLGDGFFGGWIFAWLYNRLVDKCTPS